tara:strand:- start:283 stop:984 length:702 start_codon:yes stop_codon:yes gene_type:complete
VIFPTWQDLEENYCSKKTSVLYYEDFACRRYNCSPIRDHEQVRLVFLKDVLKSEGYQTLRRRGRFIWCKNLRYEGRQEEQHRMFSFTVDNGQKRFKVSEQNVLCIPSKAYVHNNRYFRSNLKTFAPFSSVFKYEKSLQMMSKNTYLSKEAFLQEITKDNPFKSGTLVLPRVGYFFPDRSLNKKQSLTDPHPCGIILGPSFADPYLGREFYRVRFGETTYERVHPVQMEIINEV